VSSASISWDRGNALRFDVPQIAHRVGDDGGDMRKAFIRMRANSIEAGQRSDAHIIGNGSSGYRRTRNDKDVSWKDVPRS